MKYFADLREATTEATRTVRSVGLGPVLFRVVVWLAGCLALVYALPAPALVPLGLALAAVVALAPAVAPGSWAVVTLEFLALFGWLVRTTVLEEPVSWVAVAWLASALYVHHVSASLASALPMSAVVTVGAWLRPLLRVVAVLVGTGVLAAVGAWLSTAVTVATSVAIPVIGVLLALGLAVVLAIRARP